MPASGQGAAPAGKADTSSADARRATKDAVQEIIDASRESSSELHARALLVLAESNLVTGRDEKLTLIREAFQAAVSAAAPVKKTLSPIFVDDRSDVGWGNYAFTLNLDRLSLQTKVIEDADSLGPAEARSMMQELRLPDLPPVGCTEAMIYDPSAYYKLFAMLAREKAANLKDGKDTTEDLLYPAVSQMQTHKQVPLVLTLLLESDLSAEQQESLTQTFLGQLDKLRDDERGFAAELPDSSMIAKAILLYRALEMHEAGSGQGLVRSFREYLIENGRAGGCGAPTLQKQNAQKKAPLPSVVRVFNEWFRSALAGAGLSPIGPEDIESQAPVVAPMVHLYFKDAASKKLLEEAMSLRFGDTGARRSLEDLNSSGWRTQAIDYLGKVDDWPVDPFNSAEIFAEKLDLYLYVIDLAPQEDLRWTAIERALSMIENSTEETENPALWAWSIWTLQHGATHQMNTDQFERRPIHDFTQRLINSKSHSLRLIGLLEAAHLDPFSTGPSMN